MTAQNESYPIHISSNGELSHWSWASGLAWQPDGYPTMLLGDCRSWANRASWK